MTTPQQTPIRRPGFWLRAIELRKHELTRQYRKSLGDNARDGISDEDYATTVATLEKMARNLGWDESHDHDYGHRRDFGRGRRHPGMMRGHGFGHRHPIHDEAPEA